MNLLIARNERLHLSVCRALASIAIAFAFLALPQSVPAVTPPPDGGYPNSNTAEGDYALFSLTTGAWNTANGFQALYSNTTGEQNTATGYQALYSNTSGNSNTANGVQALLHNTTGVQNTATGVFSLYSNTTGWDNTATGTGSLRFNTTGFQNTATGFLSLYNNTTGSNNTATGIQALVSNTTGNNNTGNGNNSLVGNTTGNNNTATGNNSLAGNTTGNNNTANGNGALLLNKTGNGNTAIGLQALPNSTTGSFNIAVGFSAGSNITAGNDNIDIGAPGVAGESGTLRIGTGKTIAAYIKGIYGQTAAAGVGVIIGSNGQLGTVLSSARFKEAIKPMDKASEAVLALKPVTFRYKQELDPDNIPQFGLIAEEVEKINPDLVVRGEDGKVTTVRYDAVNAMILNEILKEHRKVAEQENTIAELKSLVAKQLTTNAQHQQQIEALVAGLQKVSAAVELDKPAPTQVADNR